MEGVSKGKECGGREWEGVGRRRGKKEGEEGWGRMSGRLDVGRVWDCGSI